MGAAESGCRDVAGYHRALAGEGLVYHLAFQVPGPDRAGRHAIHVSKRKPSEGWRGMPRSHCLIGRFYRKAGRPGGAWSPNQVIAGRRTARRSRACGSGTNGKCVDLDHGDWGRVTPTFLSFGSRMARPLGLTPPSKKRDLYRSIKRASISNTRPLLPMLLAGCLRHSGVGHPLRGHRPICRGRCPLAWAWMASIFRLWKAGKELGLVERAASSGTCGKGNLCGRRGPISGALSGGEGDSSWLFRHLVLTWP